MDLKTAIKIVAHHQRYLAGKVILSAYTEKQTKQAIALLIRTAKKEFKRLQLLRIEIDARNEKFSSDNEDFFFS